MYRATFFLLLFASFVASQGSLLWAQDDPLAATATCNFDDEKQLVIQYQRIPIDIKKPLAQQIPFGRPWVPGGKAITLFTNTSIQVGPITLPIGAYTMFVVPSSRAWTLIISKSTDLSGNYDDHQDLVRIPLESGELPSPETVFTVSFSHVSPQVCNIRIDADKTGHFADISRR